MGQLPETIAFAMEQRPWHGLGQQVEVGISPEEMAIAAGLDWQVKLAKVSYNFKNPDTGHSTRRLLNDKVLYRTDTGDKLTIVGPKYVPFQNDEILGFFQEYVAAGDMNIETAGSFSNGKIIWALAKMIGADFTVGPGNADQNLGYVLLVNPHIYGKAMIAKYTNISVVCWNTLQAALHGAGDGLKLWHTKEFDEDLQREAKERLGIAKERREALEANIEQLMKLEVNHDQAVELSVKYFKGTIDQPSRPANTVVSLFEGEGKGSTLPSREGNGWGYLNAVTEWCDHHYGRTQDSRMVRSWLGNGAVTKQRVMNELLAKAA